MIPSLSSTFEENNRALVTGVNARLTAFCAERALHARFLNMLSLLEHIGSRKIMTSAAMRAPSLDGLKHLAEEARHAVFFKRAAERMALRPLDYDVEDTMAVSAARLYMGRLDVALSRSLGKSTPALPYLYMSLIVELRAVWMYRIYQAVLTEQNIGLTLKSVLAEEELHFDAMAAQLRKIDQMAETRIALFSGVEEGLFRNLWAAMQEDCAVRPLAAA